MRRTLFTTSSFLCETQNDQIVSCSLNALDANNNNSNNNDDDDGDGDGEKNVQVLTCNAHAIPQRWNILWNLNF